MVSEYYIKNRDKILKRQQEKFESNREKYLEYYRIYYYRKKFGLTKKDPLPEKIFLDPRFIKKGSDLTELGRQIVLSLSSSQ